MVSLNNKLDPTELETVNTEWRRDAYSKLWTSHLDESVLITGAPSFTHIIRLMMYINKAHLSKITPKPQYGWVPWENQREPWIQTSKLCCAELKGTAGWLYGKAQGQEAGSQRHTGDGCQAGDPLAPGSSQGTGDRQAPPERSARSAVEAGGVGV